MHFIFSILVIYFILELFATTIDGYPGNGVLYNVPNVQIQVEHKSCIQPQ